MTLLKNINDKNSLWLLSLTSAAILLLLYGDLILSPSATILNSGEDGLKNYFVFLYHIIHDTGFWEFEGMNYPYGEFLLYTDTQPLLSNILKFFGADIFESLTVMHLAIWLSLVLTPIFTFKLIRTFNVAIPLAILFAMAAFMLNPQIYRLGGHYGLSYAFFIPAVWFYARMYHQSPKKSSYLIIIFLLISLSLLLHVYLGLLCGSLVLIWALLNFNYGEKYRVDFKLILAGLLPVLFLFNATKIFDSHLERTSRPYGIYEYNATPSTVFLPHHGPLAKFLSKNTGLTNEKWEGWAYPGLASLIFILLYLIYIIKERSINFKSDKLRLVLFAFLFLIVAMALPFRSIGQELLDLFPPLRQFRALGRFAWLSFYAFIVLTAILANEYWHKKNLRWIIIVAALSMCVEGLWQHLALKGILGGASESLVAQSAPDTTSKYQAILPLPWFHMGSDNLIASGIQEHNAKAMAISLQTGIPLMAADESRISWVEARELGRIFSTEPGREKPVLDLLNDKEILVFSENKRSEMESYYWDHSTPTESPEFRILRPTTLKEFPGYRFSDFADSTFQPADYPVLKSDKNGCFWFFNDFEDTPSQLSVISGTGAFSQPRFKHKKIAEFQPGTFVQNQRYELSFWAWAGAEDYIGEMIVVEEYHPQSGYKEWRYVSELNSSLEMLGDWSLGVLEFDVQRPESIVSIMLRGSAADKRPCIIDQLLVRAVDCNVYSVNIEKGRGFWNNRWYPLP
jgi:isoprenylcysteine carboxyl methyltransferase (ICMT) family protein YpbQ